jgi:hypothetical protein
MIIEHGCRVSRALRGLLGKKWFWSFMWTQDSKTKLLLAGRQGLTLLFSFHSRVALSLCLENSVTSTFVGRQVMDESRDVGNVPFPGTVDSEIEDEWV